MKYSKVISLVAFVFVMMFSIAYAEDYVNIESIVMNECDVTVTGTIEGSAKGERLLVMVLKPNCTPESIGAHGIADAEEIYTAENGKFKYVFNFMPENMDFGKYNLFMSGYAIKNNSGEPVGGFFYATEDDVKNYLDTLKAFKDSEDEQGFEEYMYQYIEMFKIYSQSYKKSDRTKLAALIYDNYDGITNENSFRNLVVRCAVTERLNSSKSEDVFDENGNFKDAEIADDPLFKGLKEIYDKNIKESAKVSLILDMCNKNFGAFKELENLFVKNVIISAVYSSKLNGVSHISDVIASAVRLGVMSADKYIALNNKKPADEYIIVQQIPESVKAFEKVVELASEQKSSEKDDKREQSAGGGGGRTKITALPAVISPTNESSKSFADLNGYSWAENDIEELYRLGVVNGVGQDMFEPSRSVTREEFLKMLVLVADLEKQGGKISFTDVPSSAWYAEYVATAVGCGIVNGKSDEIFGVNEAISRQDSAVMIYRLLKFLNHNVDSSPSVEFEDIDMVSDYAQEAVGFLSEQKIIRGDENRRFLPHQNSTRAEVAVMMMRLKRLIGD